MKLRGGGLLGWYRLCQLVPPRFFRVRFKRAIDRYCQPRANTFSRFFSPPSRHAATRFSCSLLFAFLIPFFNDPSA